MAFNSDAYIADLIKKGFSRAEAASSARYEAQAQAYVAANPASQAAQTYVGTPFGQAGSATPASNSSLQPTVTIGGAPAGYQPTTSMQPTVTIGGAPAGYTEKVTPNYITGENIPGAPKPVAGSVESQQPATGASVAENYRLNQIAATSTGPTKTQIDSIAAIKALLSSYGIGDLSAAITDAVIKGYSSATIELIMQDPNSNDPLAVAFQQRFPANKVRAAAGKSVLSPAEYLRAERSYTEVLKSYGVSNLASKEKLSQFISNDISAAEVADRVGIAINRVQNADADTKKALAEYYPMLNQVDIVGAVLDPAEGLPALKRKIQIAEIGGAALAQGIKTAEGKTNIKMGAAALADLGVTKEEAQKGFATVAEIAPRAEFLSQISTGEDYGQLQAEQETFKGLASAKRARLSLTEQEKARFGGSAGVNKSSLASQTRGAI